MQSNNGKTYDPNKVRKQNLNFLAPVRENRTGYPIEGSGIVFKNAGNTLVTLNQSWTLRPGEAFNTAAMGNYDFIAQSIDVAFGTVNLLNASNPIENRLEIATITIKLNDNDC